MATLSRILIAAALFWVLPLNVFATVVLSKTIEQMAQESATVVRARVLTRESAWDEAHRRIHTFTQFEILETWAGSASSRKLVVRTPGGEVGNIGMKVSGTPHFHSGQEVVVFLRKDPLDQKRFMVVGMSQGFFRVDRSGNTAMARSGAEGLAYAVQDRSTGVRVVSHPEVAGSFKLSDLRSRVESALQSVVPTPASPSGTVGGREIRPGD